ncbi:Nn.00g016220.m01.CDS01 [Neocucurbitaria sp. VM-36]
MMIKLIVAWIATQQVFTTYATTIQAQHQKVLVEDAVLSQEEIGYNSTWKFRWHRGVLTGFPDNQAAKANFTGSMNSFMRNHNITQAQLSIAQNGHQLADYAFNWNDPSNKDVGVDDHFLLASISKIYCVAAIRMLLRNHQLTPDTKVYQRLGYSSYFANDPRVFNITVANLLDHLGGDDSWHLGNDPAYSMRQIAIDMSGGKHPATDREVIEWKLRRPLDFVPGDKSYCENRYQRDFCYSNYGFILLSYLVANVTGTSDYYTWLNSKLLQPQGLSVSRWVTDPKAHANDIVKQIDPGCGLSALHPLDPNKTDSIYGGDGMYKESDMGGAALATSAGMLTKTLASAPVWGWQATRSPGSYRTGSTPGAFAYATQRWDGLDVAMVFNTRMFNTDDVNDVLYAQIGGYLDSHQPSVMDM